MPFTPYKRSERVASEIYEVLAEALYNELSDPRLKGVQLTGAEMTDDLQIVKVYYYIEGSDDDKKRAEKGLGSAKGFLKRSIAKRLALRITPDLRYYFDEGIEKAEKLDKVLEGLKENMGEK